MKQRYAAMLALALPAALAAQPSAAPQTDPITAAFRGRLTTMHRNLAQALDSIPADKFSYKPTPAQLTIGYIAQHLANDNYLFCSNFGDVKPTRSNMELTTPDSVKATWPKADLVTQLKAANTFCENALAQVNDQNIGAAVTMSLPNGQTRSTTRVAMVLGHALDNADHYSQLANYMRLNNILPPSALPRPAAR
ncbi:DinB family protein [Gemmatimonas sp.]|uniref:DinB family protein n=1 Tax=Gemmatimonas sp. TaxID=1962908 RepID=UPI0039830005